VLLSRLAQTAYWIGRYVERAENTARLVMVNANLVMDLPKGIKLGWYPVLNITGNRQLFFEHYEHGTDQNVVRFLVADRRNPGSILSSLDVARENMRTSRVIMPREAFESLNDLYLYARDNTARGLAAGRRFEVLDAIIRHCQQVTGLLSGTMSHDDSYTFIKMGRNLERADMTTRVIDVRTDSLVLDELEDLKPFEDIQWRSVLNSLAAYQMYRRHVHMRVSGRDVLRYLFHDREFPRSVLHTLGEVQGCLAKLPRNEDPLRSLGHAQRFIQEADLGGLGGETLNRFIDEFQIQLGAVHNQVTETYFQAELPTEEPQRKSA
jgi:uncharacterized alpha-E superfamily protein